MRSEVILNHITKSLCVHVQKRFEMEREVIEREEMSKQDVNYYQSGRRLGSASTNLTNDEIRAQRLLRYKSKINNTKEKK